MAGEEGVSIGLGGGAWQVLRFDRANRHGLIAGATGTGKTITLQTIAEGLSRAGVPVFAADVKGDLEGTRPFSHRGRALGEGGECASIPHLGEASA